MNRKDYGVKSPLADIASQIVGKHVIDNARGEACSLKYGPVVIENKAIRALRIVFRGEMLRNGGGCLFINGHSVPLNGEVLMSLLPPVTLNLELKVFADSAVRIDELTFQELYEEENLAAKCNTDADVLVVCPAYPSSENLYLCAFAHARTRWYVKHGLKVQVAVIGETWYKKFYTIDGVSVFSGTYNDLKDLLLRRQYKVVVTHFVDTKLFQVYDGYITQAQLIFICHGADVTFKELGNLCRPYFTLPMEHCEISHQNDERESYVRKYASKDNVEWVFVSEWLKARAEMLNGVSFKHYRIIGNVVDEKVFSYQPKTAEHRKHVVIIRKFDNCQVHSLDQSVLAIRCLSKRPCFNDMTFTIYGDGPYWDVLLAPVKQFPNVSLVRSFVPNHNIPSLYFDKGILLLPSRYDTQGVAMEEGASAGMVVVGSRVTTLPLFMNEQENHTLADPENPEGLAAIIERLYNNPDEFLAISRRMSEETQARFCVENTVQKEFQLIEEKREKFTATPGFSVNRSKSPILTVVVPAYNVEAYLDKTLYSLCNHRNIGKLEILVINDGSKDATSVIAKKYEQYSAGIVRLIEKENGGHGSTINVGLKEAKGKYFRIIDGDDWVDSENLAKLVDYLEDKDYDLVLTKGRYEYVEKADMENIIDYPMLNEGTVYHFDDLLYPGYGFQTYGPLLTTGNYHTDCLRRAGFNLSEKKPYVDMEFNAFAQRYVDTVVFKDLDIYRYLIGRTGQTVSPGFWRKRHGDHRAIIFNILETLDRMPDYPKWRRVEFVYKHILAMMIDSQVFMYDQLCMWNEIDKLLQNLAKWPDACKAGLEYIEAKNGDCKFIMEHYKTAIRQGRKVPLTGEGASGVSNVKACSIVMAFKLLRKTVKMIVPYGLVRLYQRVF